LREIIDPSPNKEDVQTIWEFFNSECVYCGKKLHKGQKEGHIDHLVSASCGGANQISNRVLSCATCNEKEKLDKPWEGFLTQKCPNKQIESERKSKILRWQKIHKECLLEKDILSKIKSLADDVAVCYDDKVNQAKKLRCKK
jgi:CRISPR/Cas system Type II protein with McrA/HNH and RuvC-like nuclease domain